MKDVGLKLVPNSKLLAIITASLTIKAQEEPVVGYKWTGWVWEKPVEVRDFKRITNHFEESMEEYTSNE